MPDDFTETLKGVANQIENQLRFYEEIGVTDIGGSLRAAGAQVLLSKGGIDQAAAETMDEFLSSGSDTSFEQPNLFGLGEPRPVVSAGRASRPGIPRGPQDSSLEAIREDLGECMRCKLCNHRTNIVFGEGNPRAELMFIGEGPGADEDATGRPFVGRAGQLLDKIIAAIGLRREDVYIANVVKCRPPGNRTPERDEMATCEPFLFRQIAVIRPRVIVTLGSPALQSVLRTREPLTKARGVWRECNGIALMPTFHPAYLLRSPDRKREVWEDMKKVREYLDAAK